jgi:hypothetical protein
VGISIQCASTGLYLSGGTFGSARSAWITASGTTSWNLPLATATFPTDGNYTVTVRHRYNRQRKQQQHKARHRPRKTAAARLTTTNTTGGLQLFARPEWLPGINPHETPASHGQGVGLRYSEAEFFGGGYCGEFDEFDVVFFQHFQDLVRGYSENSRGLSDVAGLQSRRGLSEQEVDGHLLGLRHIPEVPQERPRHLENPSAIRIPAGSPCGR